MEAGSAFRVRVDARGGVPVRLARQRLASPLGRIWAVAADSSMEPPCTSVRGGLAVGDGGDVGLGLVTLRRSGVLPAGRCWRARTLSRPEMRVMPEGSALRAVVEVEAVKRKPAHEKSG